VKPGWTDGEVLDRLPGLESEHKQVCPAGGHRLQVLAEFADRLENWFKVRFRRYWRPIETCREWYAYGARWRQWLCVATGRTDLPPASSLPGTPRILTDYAIVQGYIEHHTARNRRHGYPEAFRTAFAMRWATPPRTFLRTRRTWNQEGRALEAGALR
jgi:hypothetical protein